MLTLLIINYAMVFTTSIDWCIRKSWSSSIIRCKNISIIILIINTLSTLKLTQVLVNTGFAGGVSDFQLCSNDFHVRFKEGDCYTYETHLDILSRSGCVCVCVWYPIQLGNVLTVCCFPLLRTPSHTHYIP